MSIVRFLHSGNVAMYLTDLQIQSMSPDDSYPFPEEVLPTPDVFWDDEFRYLDIWMTLFQQCQERFTDHSGLTDDEKGKLKTKLAEMMSKIEDTGNIFFSNSMNPASRLQYKLIGNRITQFKGELASNSFRDCNLFINSILQLLADEKDLHYKENNSTNGPTFVDSKGKSHFLFNCIESGKPFFDKSLSRIQKIVHENRLSVTYS